MPHEPLTRELVEKLAREAPERHRKIIADMRETFQEGIRTNFEGWEKRTVPLHRPSEKVIDRTDDACESDSSNNESLT